MKLTMERLEEIFEKDSGSWDGDNALQGLNILSKYADGDTIEGAGHDEIWSIGTEEAINNGLTEEDAIKLRDLNWMIQDEYFACFV